jgi:hypothetical protein
VETVTLKRNDRAPSIAATLKQAGTAIDLTGSTVKLFTRQHSNNELKIDGASVTVVSPAAGTVRYDMTAVDMDTAGQFDLEWEITLPSGKKTSVPNDGYDRLVILADLG